MNLFKSLIFRLFNTREIFFHHVTSEETDLKTGLFETANTQQMNKILKSARLVKYPQGAIFLHKDNVSDALYIILDGSVMVFIYDETGKKIFLAKLQKGDFIGEQGIIGNKLRNANVETLDDTTLIRINAEEVIPFWKENKVLESNLKKIGFKQALQALTSSVKLFIDIVPFFNKLKDNEQNQVEFAEGTVIFNEGEFSDKVYFIVEGHVKIEFVDKINQPKQSLTLSQGHFFGELGVIENQSRRATAIATTPLRLIVIPKEQFKEFYHENPNLQLLLSKLRKTYELPLEGLVEQYIGNSNETGPTITNIYKMNDGRTAVASRSIALNFFTMSLPINGTMIPYKHVRGENDYTILYFLQRRLVSIENYGDWDDLSIACQVLLKSIIIDYNAKTKFTQTGKLDAGILNEEDEIICRCMAVKKSKLQNLIDDGVNDFESLSNKSGACTVCGSCWQKIIDILKERS